MKKLILLVLFMCVAVIAQAAKMEAPAPPGSGTYAELDGDNTFTGDNVFDSIQADTITVGRIPDTVTETTIAIASIEDDTFTLFSDPFWANTTEAPALGFSGNERNFSLRFENLGIPQGATIVSAQLKLKAYLTSTKTVKWKVGIVNSLAAVTPTSIETFPAQSSIIDYLNQDSGTIVTPTAWESFYFPTDSTGTVFLDALQSLVSNSSWGSGSAIMAVLSDDGSVQVPASTVNMAHFGPNSAVQDAYPKLIITYTALEYEDVAAVNDNAPRIVLPDTLYGVVGDTLQLFIRGMVEAQDPYVLSAIVSAGDGNAYPRYFEVTPATDTNLSLSVKVLSTDYETISEDTVPIVITDPAAALASPVNILCLGDSLTAPGIWPAELYRRLATNDVGPPVGLNVADITFVGDKDLTAYTGTAAYTGMSGWSFEAYVGESTRSGEEVTLNAHGRTNTCPGSVWTQGGNSWAVAYVDTNVIKFNSGAGVTLPQGGGTLVNTTAGTCNDVTDIVYTSSVTTKASPFWDVTGDALDFTVWQTRNVTGTLDAVYVLLGWNSVSSANQTDWIAEMADVRTFLNTLQEDIPAVKVRIIGIQVPSTTGGLGANYASNNYLGQYYGVLKSANNLNAEYQDLANEVDYSSWVEFIGMMPQFDAEYNYASTSTDVNIRNSTTQELIGTNGLHPETSGYDQIADAVYREFVHTFLE